MRNFSFWFTTAIILLLTVSCSRYADDLNRAEQLLENKPDSALRLLKTIPAHKLFLSADKALYAYLYCRALDNQIINLESDSLINIATDYYTENDPLRAGYAWLVKVHMAQYNKNATEQVRCLFKAEEFAKRAGDNKLYALVNYEKANLHFAQCDYKKAIYFFKTATAYFNKTGFNYHSAVCNFHTGFSFIYLHKADSASKYFQISQEIALRLHDKVLLSTIYKSVGSYYFEKKDFEKALEYFRQAPLTGDIIYDSNKQYLIADAYIKLGNFDSAKVYMQKVKLISKIGPDYYRLWQHIYEKTGNSAKAIYYADKVVMATDSLYKQKLQESFDGLEKKYNYQNLQLANQRLIIRDKQNNVYLLLCIVFIVGFIATFLLWRLKVKQQQFITQTYLLNQETALFEKEKENSALLTKQLELQSILISNINMHRQNTVKRPGLWKNTSGQIVLDQFEAFHKELTTHINLEYNNFTHRLKEHFPALTDRDLFFCSLLLAKFESGMIATVLDVNIESVNKHRHRLRKKLQVADSTENLVDFLRNF